MKRKRVNPEISTTPRCKDDPIIRNDIIHNNTVPYKPCHLTICNRNSDAASFLSALIQLYDLYPEARMSGELYLDNTFIRHLVYNKPGAFCLFEISLKALCSMELISIRSVKEPQFDITAEGVGCYIRLNTEYIERWLEKKKGWKILPRRN